MTMVVDQTSGKSRPRSVPCLAVFAVLLAVVMIGGDPMSAAGGENEPGIALAVEKLTKAALISSFEQRNVVGGGGTAEGDAVPVGDVAEVSVATNTADWGVAVRFTLPEGGKPKHQNAAARCRLVDDAGVVISERYIENGEVFLEGNGRRGYHTFFLEVDGLSDAFGIERLTQPMVEVEGRLATDGM